LASSAKAALSTAGVAAVGAAGAAACSAAFGASAGAAAVSAAFSPHALSNTAKLIITKDLFIVIPFTLEPKTQGQTA
jgi:hypothetical protein